MGTETEPDWQDSFKCHFIKKIKIKSTEHFVVKDIFPTFTWHYTLQIRHIAKYSLNSFSSTHISTKGYMHLRTLSPKTFWRKSSLPREKFSPAYCLLRWIAHSLICTYCHITSTLNGTVTFFLLLRAYAIFLHLFLFSLLSVSLLWQLVSPSFPKISFLNPSIIKKITLVLLTRVFSPHSTPSKYIHQECFTRIPRTKMNIVQEFMIGHWDRFIFKDHIAVFIPLKIYLTSHCSGTHDPAHQDAWSPKVIDRICKKIPNMTNI